MPSSEPSNRTSNRFVRPWVLSVVIAATTTLALTVTFALPGSNFGPLTYLVLFLGGATGMVTGLIAYVVGARRHDHHQGARQEGGYVDRHPPIASRCSSARMVL